MSVIGGPNNPISNGLVYALDFKNNRCYVSGSNSAKSLVFNPTTASISAGFDNTTNTLIFSGSQNGTTNLTLPQVNYDKSFTISYVTNIKNGGLGFGGNYGGSNTILYTYFDPTAITLGFYGAVTGFSNIFFTRTYPASGNNHYTWVYIASGSFTLFVNGVPVSSSVANNGSAVNNGSDFKLSGRASDTFWSGSLGNIYIYNRALTNDEIRTNYTLASREYGLPTPPSFSIDENAYLFSQTAGITSSAYISALDTFVRGLKSASLWDKMVGIYPFLGGNNTLNQLNLKESSLAVYPASFTGNWSSSFSGSRNNNTASYATLTEFTPSTYHPLLNTQSFHMAYLSYDTPANSGSLMGATNQVIASGGQVFDISGSRFHVFTASANLTVTQGGPVQAFVVAGGGSGGSNKGGGGGAGGITTGSRSINTGTFNIIVGAGGVGRDASGTINGNSGSSSSFLDIQTIGGGGGGAEYFRNAQNGGSGGGASRDGIPGTGSAGQGFSGGSGSDGTYNYTGGGGGGAGQVGQNATAVSAGIGGSGSFFPQYVGLGFGFPAGWFGGGGGGGVYGDASFPGGIGGIGGGGVGGKLLETGSSAIKNTGGGGGGGGDIKLGGDGGSGIVIVSYPINTGSVLLNATPSDISGSINNTDINGFFAGGPLGLVMTSRTGSRAYSVSKNKVIFNYTSSASSSISNNILLNAVNVNGTASFPIQNNVAYASVGAGLTNSEVNTYYDIVNTFQKSVGRSDLDYISVLGYAAALGYSLPTSDQQVKQERLMSDLKQAGIWNKLDTFGVFATNGDSNFALVDWKRLTSYTAVNSPSFTSNQGFTGNSLASSSISLNYQSVTNWVNASLNNACEFVWNFGQSGLVTGDSSINKYINTGTGSVVQRFHSGTTLPFTFAANETTGLHSRVRNNSADYQLYFNENLKGTTTVASFMPTSDFFLFKVGVPGYFESWFDTSAKIYGYGAALTPTEISNLYTILNTYLNSL